MICFLGDSYAAVTLKEGARRRGLALTDNERDADILFLSQDMPTDGMGIRDLDSIRTWIKSIFLRGRYLVISSQVPPGFIGEFNNPQIFHQAETLRIEDGAQRAMYPEMFIIGKHGDCKYPPPCYQEYLDAFDCPVHLMSYAEAEFAKIAINMTLASQVDNANRLSAAAAKCGADWGRVSRALRHDSRIGKYSYLTPGRWQDSRHLLRDAVTLAEIEAK